MDTENTVDSLGFFIIHLVFFLTFVNLFSHLLVGREADIKKHREEKIQNLLLRFTWIEKYSLFGMSKILPVDHETAVLNRNLICKPLAYNLKKINPELYFKTQKLLQKNKEERHLRGGEATKQKFLNAKQAT